jgi:hypothetical protein
MTRYGHAAVLALVAGCWVELALISAALVVTYWHLRRGLEQSGAPGAFKFVAIGIFAVPPALVLFLFFDASAAILHFAGTP